MRRSSKASHLISQSGQDETYKFRCMEYLNFVLDQVVNQENRFKLYSSHIEHLLRSNLNDITIQDIEKIKRMLEEGQKQKVQTQQTGEFINYDLIQKKRYSHPYTHYYLQQAPQQSLAIFYGTNDYTLQQVQQIKQRHKQQRLQQHNYKMLDLMFKLPQDYQKLQDQIEKQIEKQHDDIQPDIEMQFQKGNLVHNDGQQYKQQRQQQIVAEKGLATFNGSNDIGAINNKQKIISNSQGNVSVHQNVSSQIQQYQGNQNNLITQNQKPLIAPTPPGDIDFVEIKKKKTTKKKPTLSNQQKPITQEKPIQQQHSINANNNKNMLQNLQQHDQDPNVNNNQQPQKRKYIRKKPIEPKKPKTQKSKLSISQNVNKEINVQQQQRNNQPNNNNLLGETINNVQGEPVKQPNIKQLLAIKKQASQKQQKDKKPKKPKKSTTILALTNDNQNTLTQTKKSPLIEEQIQIMLPCEQQVKELQREMIELNKNLQDQKIMFEKNMHQVEELRSRVQAGDEIKEQGMGLENQRECQEMYLKGGSNKMGEIGGVQKMMDIIESQLKGQQSDVLINKDDLPLLSNNENNQYHLQQPPRQYPRIQTTQLTEVAQQQTSKKQKQSSKVGIYKKQSKKSSSQSYKPQQDQLQSISQIQNNGKVLILNQDDDDHKSINNSKKDIKKHYVQHQKKRKYTKKKGEKELLTGEKKQQSVNNIINNNNQSYTQSVNNNPLSQNNQSQTVNLNNNNNSLSSAQNNILSQSTNKQKKPKLTGQQRQRMKLQKQRLKQMRLKQKQERKKLKQLQKMEKQTIKLANKMSEKSINNIISSRSKQLKENVNNGSVIANVIANVSVNANANVNANVSVSGGMLHGDNNIDPQHLIPNIVSNDNNNSNYNNSNSNNNNNNNNINNNNNTNNSQIDIHNEKNLQIDQKPKPFLNNVLNESIGNNSTKEDIKINTSFDFITNLVHKQVDLLQQMKKEQQQQKQQQIEYGKLKRNYPFVNTAADNNNNNNNNNDDPLDILNQQYQILNQQYQTDKYLQNNTPKKRLKLISKQSQQYQQPHYYAKQQLSKQQQSNSINNINNHPSNKFLIQVFGHIIDNQQNHQSKCQSKQQQKGKQHYQQIILNDQIILQKQLLEKQNAYKEQSSSLHQ